MPTSRSGDAGRRPAVGSSDDFVDSLTADCTQSKGSGGATLVSRLRAGDQDAFVEAVEEFGPSLKRMAKSYVRDAAAADDVVQETWLGFLSSLPDYEERCSIKTWLFRILFHKAQARVRVDKRLVAFSALVADEVHSPFRSVDESRFHKEGEAGPAGHWTSPPPPWKTSPEQILLDKESMAAVRAAIDELPPAQATVILMRDVEGLSSRDVCRSLGLSAANQRVLLHRARTGVRNALEARYGGRP